MFRILSGLPGFFVLFVFFGVVSCGPSFSEVNAVDGSSSPHWIEVGNGGQGTELKKIPVQAGSLVRGDEVCRLDSVLIELSSPPLLLDNGHYLINRLSIPEGCSFSSGFVFAEHVESVSESAIRQKTNVGYRLRIDRDTWLKRGTGQSDGLDLGAEKCTLSVDEVIPIQGAPLEINEHWVVNLSSMIFGCEFSVGLVFKGHVTLESPPPEPLLHVPYLAQPNGNTCGPTSVSMVLRYFGMAAKIFDVNSRVPSTKQNPPNNAAEFKRWGLYSAFTWRGTYALVRAQIDAGRPVVLHGFFTNSGHVVVVVGYTEAGLILNDPWGVFLGYRGWYDRSRSGYRNMITYRQLGSALSDGGIWMSAADTKPFSF